MRIGGTLRSAAAFPCHVTKRILVLQHAPGGFLGALEQPLLDAGFEIHTWRTLEEPAPPLHVGEIDGLIGLGGIMNPDEDVAYAWLEEVRAMLRQAVAREIPTLGVCLGVQLMAQALGGSAGPLGRLRVGFLPVEVQAGDDPLLGGLPDTLRPLSWHEYIAIPPPAATVLAAADGTPQAIRFAPLAWGVQFHAELAGHVERWFENGGDPLRARGVDVAEIVDELPAMVDSWRPHGDLIAARFARLAAGQPV
jgi:GMP synthase-like glutamine amidotransferase